MKHILGCILFYSYILFTSNLVPELRTFWIKKVTLKEGPSIKSRKNAYDINWRHNKHQQFLTKHQIGLKHNLLRLFQSCDYLILHLSFFETLAWLAVFDNNTTFTNTLLE